MAAAIVLSLLAGALPLVWLLRRLRRTVSQLQDENTRCKSRIDDLERRIATQTAELEQARKEADGLAYSVSHDLTAPLRSIAGFADLLKDEAPAMSGQGREWLERIQYNAQRMSAMIADLLRLSRIGRVEMNLQTVDLHAVAADAVRAVGAEHAETGVDIAPLPSLSCDAKLVRELFHILAANAFKFSARTQMPRIEIGSATEGGEVRIFVRDNGAGFNMRYAEKLFGAFQRLHKESEYPGNGIGLAIARKIVQRHGGRIWAQSTPGEGATFSFTLGAGTGAT